MIDNFALVAAAAGRIVVLTFQAVAPIALAALVVLAVALTARYLLAGHRSGMARLAAADRRSTEAARRARRNRRTVVELDARGRARVTVEPRRTR